MKAEKSRRVESDLNEGSIKNKAFLIEFYFVT